MTYQLKAGEEWRDGKLYGWTGRKCLPCKGTGEGGYYEGRTCTACAGTGDEHGLMPVQPHVTDISQLKAIVTKAVEVVSARQDELAQSAAVLAATVGPLAAAHRLGELALEMYDLASHRDVPK